MKKLLAVLAVMAFFMTIVNGAYAATASSTVPATATITGKCVAAGTPSIDFGSLDASTVGPYPGTVVDPTLWCTKSVSIAVTNNGGQNFSGTFRLKSGTDYIGYTLTYTTPLTGQGKTVDIGGQGAGKLGIVASIPAGNIDAAPAGTYTDSVVLTFTY